MQKVITMIITAIISALADKFFKPLLNKTIQYYDRAKKIKILKKKSKVKAKELENADSKESQSDAFDDMP